MYGFRYRGRHSKEFGVDLLSYTINSPELREYEDDISGLPGAVDYGTDWGKRAIDVSIDITPTSEQFKLQQSKIFNWLKPTLPAGILVFDELPDRFYFAKFTGKLGVQQFGHYGQFDFSMKCTDPFIYGPEQIYEHTITKNPDLSYVASGGTEFTYPVMRLKNIGANTINGFEIKTITEVD